MWNTRRSAALYAEKVEDSSERLQGMLRKNNCLDKTEIERQVRSLPGLSVPNLNALLERTSAGIITLQLLQDVIKQQKKLTEAKTKVSLTIFLSFLCIMFYSERVHSIVKCPCSPRIL